MNVQLDQILNDLDNKPLKDGPEGLPLTLKKVCVGALLAASPRENPEGSEKYRRWELGHRLSPVNSLELTAEEISTLKKLIGEAWTTAVVGPAWLALEGKSTP